MSGHQELKPVQGLNAVNVSEEEFRNATEGMQGKLICWVSNAAMGESLSLRILDIVPFAVTEYAYIASSKGVARKLIAVAEAAGYSQEICAYYKVAIGYALLMARGQLDLVPEAPIMPRPEFIWSSNACQSTLQSSEALARILDVPVIGIDVPFEYDVANRERNLHYVEGQLREALDILETWVGRPFDWARLAEHIKGLAEVAEIRNEVTQGCKTCPSVYSAFDLIPASWVHRACQVEESKRVYGALREEIKGKIERGERDVLEEKIRIMWYGPFPWEKTGAIKELLARHGATLCSTLVSIGTHPSERGEGLDPDNPLRTAAWMYEYRPTNVSIDARTEDWIKPGIEGYNVDGLIFHFSRTCKSAGIPLLVWAAEVEKELGVPTLMLESDAIDPAFYAQTQVENRIESFLESIARPKVVG